MGVLLLLRIGRGGISFFVQLRSTVAALLVATRAYWEGEPFKPRHKAGWIGERSIPGDRIVIRNTHEVGRVHRRVSDSFGVWDRIAGCPLPETAPQQKAALEAVKADARRRWDDGMVNFNHPPYGSAPCRAISRSGDIKADQSGIR